MEVLANLGKAISGGLLNLLVYGVILLVFVFGILKCVLPVIQNRGLLRRAIRNVRAGEAAKRSWQSQDFLGKGSLYAHWSEYLNNLFFADGVYHNPSSVEDYINEETVIYGPGRGAFADAVPGLLVSVGFLGTLIGLARGLSGFSMSDSQAVMDSIVTLIPGMRYAFTTSIVGVVCSVSFTLLVRFAYGSTERTLRNFYGALSRYAKLMSVDPMTQVAIYQQEQTMLIRQMAEDLSGKLSDNIASAVGQALQPLNESLRDFMELNTEGQMAFLDKIVRYFMSRMEELMGSQIQRLSKTIEDCIARQERTLKGVQEGLEDGSEMLERIRELAHISEEMVRTNAAYIGDLRENQKQTDEAFERVGSLMERMELVARQQAGYLKSVQEMQENVSHSLDTMRAAMDNFARRVGEQGAKSADELAGAADELRATGEELRKLHREFAASISDELKMTLDSYQDYVNQFTKRVDYLAGNIGDSVSRLPAAVNGSVNAMLDQVNRITDALNQAQRALNDAVDRLYDGPGARH